MSLNASQKLSSSYCPKDSHTYISSLDLCMLNPYFTMLTGDALIENQIEESIENGEQSQPSLV